MYDFSVLTARCTEQYKLLTYPAYRPLLKQLRRDSSVVAVGLHNSSFSIGLALASIDSDSSRAQILSLFVRPDYRNQGLGKSLFMCLENLLYRRGCSRLELVYVPNQTTPALEAILAQRQWNTPLPQMLMGQTTTKQLIFFPFTDVRQSMGTYKCVNPLACA